MNMQIDYSKLTRDYQKQPVKVGECLIYEDVYYLYWELNLTKKQVAKILGCSDNKVYTFAKQQKLIKSQSMITESQKQLMVEKYGTDNIMKTDKGRQRCSESMKQTFSKKHDEISDKRKQTCLEKYGVENPSQNDEIKKKKEITTLSNYGVRNPLQSKEIQEKVSNTFKEKYDANPLSKDSNIYESKVKKGIKDKYGVENAMQNKDIAQKTAHTLKQNQNLYKEQSLEKYGVEYPAQLPEVLNKINNTKRINNSFNISKPEKRIEKLLLQKFEIMRQYRSEEYPFACDFYIPSLSLYIEYHGNWTHGTEPFDENNDNHLHILNEWKQKAKTSKFYQNAIYTWTDLDVRKLECVKRNNLNCLFFYDEDEFMCWYEKLN